MASFPVIQLSISHLGDLIALEKAAFSSEDRQSPRSLKYLLSQAHAAVWGIEMGGVLQAAAIVLYRRGSQIARLYSIATAAQARKSGLATILLLFAEQCAKDKGCREMRAEVREDNRASRSLFEHGGYQVMGRHARYYAGGVDAIRYAKALDVPHG